LFFICCLPHPYYKMAELFTKKKKKFVCVASLSCWLLTCPRPDF
jgi:hypothetical protein